MAESGYSLHEYMQMEACTNCRLCAGICPAVSASQDGQLSGAYRLDVLRRIVRRRTGLFRHIFRLREPTTEELKRFSETVYRCTLCGNCQAVCPVGLSLRDLWLSLRSDLVGSDAYPEKVDMIRDNLDESHNVFGEENDERAEWVEDLRDPPDHGYLKEEAEVVYFTGCVASFFPLAQKIPMDMTGLLEAGQVDFTLLGEEEWCCGFPLLGAGHGASLDPIIEHNLAAVREKGAKRVVFACPGCFNMWQEHYPKEFEIVHSTQFLLEMIRDGRLPLKQVPLKVTYHDPCDLGRASHVFEAPREVISTIPGVALVELNRNRENCLCCGGGGNLEMIDAGLSGNIAGQKIAEVLETGAQAVVTACQQCVRTMTAYVKRNKIELEVMDISALLHRAIDV